MNTQNTIEDGGPAFPIPHTVADANDPSFKIGASGIPLRAYAAIKLRVPESGIDWLDDMIRKSQRNEFAGQALVGVSTAAFSGPGASAIYTQASVNGITETKAVALIAYEFSDATIESQNKPDHP